MFTLLLRNVPALQSNLLYAIPFCMFYMIFLGKCKAWFVFNPQLNINFLVHFSILDSKLFKFYIAHHILYIDLFFFCEVNKFIQGRYFQDDIAMQLCDSFKLSVILVCEDDDFIRYFSFALLLFCKDISTLSLLFFLLNLCFI